LCVIIANLGLAACWM